jgi:hypothetical protein
MPITKPAQKMLCKEIITVCSDNHMQQLNTLCGHNAEFLNVKEGDTYSYYCS